MLECDANKQTKNKQTNKENKQKKNKQTNKQTNKHVNNTKTQWRK